MRVQSGRLVWGLGAVFALIGPISGCAGQEAADHPSAQVALQVAPLSLGDISKACYDMRVTNGAGEVVWQQGDPDNNHWFGAYDSNTDGNTDGSPGYVNHDPHAICSDRYGNGPGGDVFYVGPCDASTDQVPGKQVHYNQHTVVLWMDSLVDKNGDYVQSHSNDPTNGGWTDPCPDGCALQATCLENSDVRVQFDITIARDADQGFFDVQVKFEDIFCSAKVDCAYGDEPIKLLHDWADERAQTAVIGFACTQGPNADDDTVLNVSDVRVRCENGNESMPTFGQLQMMSTCEANGTAYGVEYGRSAQGQFVAAGTVWRKDVAGHWQVAVLPPDGGDDAKAITSLLPSPAEAGDPYQYALGSRGKVGFDLGLTDPQEITPAIYRRDLTSSNATAPQWDLVQLLNPPDGGKLAAATYVTPDNLHVLGMAADNGLFGSLGGKKNAAVQAGPTLHVWRSRHDAGAGPHSYADGAAVPLPTAFDANLNQQLTATSCSWVQNQGKGNGGAATSGDLVLVTCHFQSFSQFFVLEINPGQTASTTSLTLWPLGDFNAASRNFRVDGDVNFVAGGQIVATVTGYCDNSGACTEGYPDSEIAVFKRVVSGGYEATIVDYEPAATGYGGRRNSDGVVTPNSSWDWGVRRVIGCAADGKICSVYATLAQHYEADPNVSFSENACPAGCTHCGTDTTTGGCYDTCLACQWRGVPRQMFISFNEDASAEAGGIGATPGTTTWKLWTAVQAFDPAAEEGTTKWPVRETTSLDLQWAVVPHGGGFIGNVTFANQGGAWTPSIGIFVPHYTTGVLDGIRYRELPVPTLTGYNPGINSVIERPGGQIEISGGIDLNPQSGPGLMSDRSIPVAWRLQLRQDPGMTSPTIVDDTQPSLAQLYLGVVPGLLADDRAMFRGFASLSSTTIGLAPECDNMFGQVRMDTDFGKDVLGVQRAVAFDVPTNSSGAGCDVATYSGGATGCGLNATFLPKQTGIYYWFVPRVQAAVTGLGYSAFGFTYGVSLHDFVLLGLEYKLTANPAAQVKLKELSVDYDGHKWALTIQTLLGPAQSGDFQGRELAVAGLVRIDPDRLLWIAAIRTAIVARNANGGWDLVQVFDNPEVSSTISGSPDFLDPVTKALVGTDRRPAFFDSKSKDQAARFLAWRPSNPADPATYDSQPRLLECPNGRCEILAAFAGLVVGQIPVADLQGGYQLGSLSDATVVWDLNDSATTVDGDLTLPMHVLDLAAFEVRIGNDSASAYVRDTVNGYAGGGKFGGADVAVLGHQYVARAVEFFDPVAGWQEMTIVWHRESGEFVASPWGAGASDPYASSLWKIHNWDGRLLGLEHEDPNSGQTTQSLRYAPESDPATWGDPRSWQNAAPSQNGEPLVLTVEDPGGSGYVPFSLWGEIPTAISGADHIIRGVAEVTVQSGNGTASEPRVFLADLEGVNGTGTIPSTSIAWWPSLPEGYEPNSEGVPSLYRASPQRMAFKTMWFAKDSPDQPAGLISLHGFNVNPSNHTLTLGDVKWFNSAELTGLMESPFGIANPYAWTFSEANQPRLDFVLASQQMGKMRFSAKAAAAGYSPKDVEAQQHANDIYAYAFNIGAATPSTGGSVVLNATRHLPVPESMSGLATTETILDPTIEEGNGYAEPPDESSPVYQYGVYRGNEALTCGSQSCNKRFWNFAVGFNPEIPNCRLYFDGTASRRNKDVFKNGYLQKVNGWSPVIDFTVDLTDASGNMVCSQNPLDGEQSQVRVMYVSPALKKDETDRGKVNSGDAVPDQTCYAFDGTNVANTCEEKPVYFEDAFNWDKLGGIVGGGYMPRQLPK